MASPTELSEQVFEATDLDIASTLLREQYSSMRLNATGERHLLQIVRRDLGRARIDSLRFDFDLDIESDPLGSVCIGRVRRGQVAYVSGPREQRRTSGEVFLAAQPQDGFTVLVRRLGIECAILDPGLFDDVAQADPWSAGSVRILSQEPVSGEAARRWSRTFDFVQDELRALPTGQHQPLVVAQLERLLAATALATFPTNAVVDPSIEDRHDAHPLALRRATAYIEDNAHRDIGLADIARAADVSIRSVQLAFRRGLDTTPLAYLRRVRLHRVHDELLAASAGSTSVSDVAGRWGFFNLGRFAGQYRAELGELPRDTLRR